MAIMRPPLEECERLITPLNEGERRVAEKLSELDDEWTVYVQPRLAQDIPDFVAVHPRHGVCAIEVKHWARGGYRPGNGGTIEYLSGGVWHTSKEAPRYQASRYRSTIYEHFFAQPQDGRDPSKAVRAIVVLPEWSTTDAEKLLSQQAVSPAEKSVAVFGGDALHRSACELVGTPGLDPAPASIKRVHQHLKASVFTLDFAPAAKLSPGAKNIADNANDAKRRRIRGSAGCGKTFGLAVRAARLAAERKHVLVLTYNVTLSNYLRTLVGARCVELQANPAFVTCTNFHSFCSRVADDAERAGLTCDVPDGTKKHDVPVAKAMSAAAQGFGARYDAVLIDEGQDFNLDWWNFLRNHVAKPDAEMVLVVDPTQDIYGQKAWTDEAKMTGSGLVGSWTLLTGSYRLPRDMAPIVNTFAARFVEGERIHADIPDDHVAISGEFFPTRRRWLNIMSTVELGRSVGEAVVEMCAAHDDLSPADIVFLCEEHEQGREAVRVIEAAGLPVHHIFASHKQDVSRRKRRFWPDAPGIKGCTVQSYKGWESPALVMGIGARPHSLRLGYVAMTRLRVREGGPATITVVNANPVAYTFDSSFSVWERPDIPLWAPPTLGDRRA